MGLVVPIEERFKFVMNNASSTPQSFSLAVYY